MRIMGGSALLGRLLAQADAMSLTAWCSSSAVRWIFSRLSRSVRDTACSTPFGSAAIPRRLHSIGCKSNYRKQREALSIPVAAQVPASARGGVLEVGCWRLEIGGGSLEVRV